MKRDNILRGLFIVLLGIVLPALSGVISWDTGSVSTIVLTSLYFIASFFFGWMICLWVVPQLRSRHQLASRPFLKILLLCLTTSFISASMLALATYAWQRQGGVEWNVVETMVWLTMGAAVLFTLMFEVAKLSRERAVDVRVVRQLDKKRAKAEIQALKNQLDPHFMFNALSTLSHLIQGDAQKAYQYNLKLAEVYNYFLVNKKRDLIPLAEELQFIEDYFYLLQIRHGNRLKVKISISTQESLNFFILPGALQIPVENAIKHNELSDQHPLLIEITCEGDLVRISNEICPKPYLVTSTQIGLQNLSRRYWLACHEKINIQKTPSAFIVELPLIAA